MIEIDNVAKAFGRSRDVHAVDGVTFEAAHGEITGLLGPNGAGKTTLLRMLATLMIPDSGIARVDGSDVVRERYAVRRRIGVLSDARGLYLRLTARENIRYFGALQGLSGKALDARIDELIGALSISDIAERRDHEISFKVDVGADDWEGKVPDAGQALRQLGGKRPTCVQDVRKALEDKNLDTVSIATPNHWHSLIAIWACQAGKDVYVEKPACHNLFEGRQMVAAARKYNRMVQVGSQSRTIAHKMKAMDLLQKGAIGQIYHARGLCYRRRFSIGHTPDEPVPVGLDWDRFLGPAQVKPYSKNKFAYNWHWFWDTGNGDIGNQGVHEMDVCLWGLGRGGWPVWPA